MPIKRFLKVTCDVIACASSEEIEHSEAVPAPAQWLVLWRNEIQNYRPATAVCICPKHNISLRGE